MSQISLRDKLFVQSMHVQLMLLLSEVRKSLESNDTTRFDLCTHQLNTAVDTYNVLLESDPDLKAYNTELNDAMEKILEEGEQQ